jgi:hypothetical protein
LRIFGLPRELVRFLLPDPPNARLRPLFLFIWILGRATELKRQQYLVKTRPLAEMASTHLGTHFREQFL